ncbi:Urease operon accessory protein [Phyllobacterium sp. SB3]|uniref:Urease operon accessory protein n=1 Tax=Phyllobacterium sp. SB3 TaxID=3156073 RepID=UPI0032AFB53B
MDKRTLGSNFLHTFCFFPQTIVIVGNGPVDRALSLTIDRADLVIRFNDCRSVQGGSNRTDVVAVCNTGRPAKSMLASKKWRQLHPVNQAAEIWCVRDPKKMRSLKPVLATTHPELEDFCDDRTAAFEDFCVLTGKRCIIIGKAFQDDVEAALDPFGPSPYVVPSSGMIVIETVLQSYKSSTVCIVGFSHEGWELHPFGAEKRLVQHYVNTRRLIRL